MTNPNQDLIDLCQLNQLRDANNKSVRADTEKERDAQGIDWKIRDLAHKIIQKSKGEE